MINEVEFTVLNKGGVDGFVGLAQQDKGKHNVWGVQDITEGYQCEPVSIGDSDVDVALANCFESSVVGCGDRLWLDELEVGECIDVWGHVAGCSAIINFNSFSWVLAASVVSCAK